MQCKLHASTKDDPNSTCLKFMLAQTHHQEKGKKEGRGKSNGGKKEKGEGTGTGRKSNWGRKGWHSKKENATCTPKGVRRLSWFQLPNNWKGVRTMRGLNCQSSFQWESDEKSTTQVIETAQSNKMDRFPDEICQIQKHVGFSQPDKCVQTHPNVHEWALHAKMPATPSQCVITLVTNQPAVVAATMTLSGSDHMHWQATQWNKKDNGWQHQQKPASQMMQPKNQTWPEWQPTGNQPNATKSCAQDQDLQQQEEASRNVSFQCHSHVPCGRAHSWPDMMEVCWSCQPIGVWCLLWFLLSCLRILRAHVSLLLVASGLSLWLSLICWGCHLTVDGLGQFLVGPIIAFLFHHLVWQHVWSPQSKCQCDCTMTEWFVGGVITHCRGVMHGQIWRENAKALLMVDIGMWLNTFIADTVHFSHHDVWMTCVAERVVRRVTLLPQEAGMCQFKIICMQLLVRHTVRHSDVMEVTVCLTVSWTSTTAQQRLAQTRHQTKDNQSSFHPGCNEIVKRGAVWHTCFDGFPVPPWSSRTHFWGFPREHALMLGPCVWIFWLLEHCLCLEWVLHLFGLTQQTHMIFTQNQLFCIFKWNSTMVLQHTVLKIVCFWNDCCSSLFHCSMLSTPHSSVHHVSACWLSPQNFDMCASIQNHLHVSHGWSHSQTFRCDGSHSLTVSWTSTMVQQRLARTRHQTKDNKSSSHPLCCTHLSHQQHTFLGSKGNLFLCLVSFDSQGELMFGFCDSWNCHSRVTGVHNLLNCLWNVHPLSARTAWLIASALPLCAAPHDFHTKFHHGSVTHLFWWFFSAVPTSANTTMKSATKACADQVSNSFSSLLCVNFWFNLKAGVQLKTLFLWKGAKM